MTTGTSQISSPNPLASTDAGRGARIAGLVLASWFGAATALGASGVLPSLPRFALPLIIWSPIIGCIALYRRNGDVRAALSAVPLAVPLLFHAIVRTGFGVGIMIEGERGGVPRLFADVAGPGDVLVGVLAVAALLVSGRSTTVSLPVLLAWNWLALADIVVAVLLGQREVLFGAGPASFAAVAHFPFAWLPTFVVPLVIVTHLWMFTRLRRIG